MRHLVQRRTGVDTYLLLIQTDHESGAVGDGIEEHRNGAEDDHRGYGYRRFVALRLDHCLCAQHCCRTADSATRGGQQGGLFVHIQQFA